MIDVAEAYLCKFLLSVVWRPSYGLGCSYCYYIKRYIITLLDVNNLLVIL